MSTFDALKNSSSQLCLLAQTHKTWVHQGQRKDSRNKKALFVRQTYPHHLEQPVNTMLTKKFGAHPNDAHPIFYSHPSLRASMCMCVPKTFSWIFPYSKLNPCYPVVNVGPAKFKIESLVQDLGQIMTTLTKGIRGLESGDKFFKVKSHKLFNSLPLTPPLHCDLKRSTIIHNTETNYTLHAMEKTNSRALI